MCEMVATRGTCDRKQVGAILVRDKRILTTGYNGSIPGSAHCDDPEMFWECQICGNKTIEAPESVNGIGPMCRKTMQCMGHPARQKFGGHIMEDDHCVRTVHAEINAITQAARLGISTQGATVYCNTMPCWACFKTIVVAGIVEIVYRDEYGTDDKIERSTKNLSGFTIRRHLAT